MRLITATPHRITQCYTAGPSSVSNGIEPEMLLTAWVNPIAKNSPPLLRAHPLPTDSKLGGSLTIDVDELV